MGISVREATALVAAWQTILSWHMPPGRSPTWTKLGERLPQIARPILLARWDAGGFWRVRDAVLLIRHEGVSPRPSDMDSGLPTDWWFEAVYGGGDTRLGTPDLMWAPMPTPDAKP